MLERIVKKIDFKFLIAAIVLFAAAVTTVTGDLQKVIMFRDATNEMFFTLVTFLMSIVCFLYSPRNISK